MASARRADQSPAPANAPATGGRLTDAVDPEIPPKAPIYTTRDEVESLGVSLGPALHDACGDRLGDIEWFRSPWQKSGAATGLTSWRLPNGRVIEAIAKVPVGYREYFWSTRLGEVDPMRWESDECRRLPVPRVLASGMELGGYDAAWVVQERVAGETVGKAMNAGSLEQLFLATARFHQQAREVKPAERAAQASEPDWRAILERARTKCVDNAIDRRDEWLRAIDAVDGILPALLERWHARPWDTWCHGDLHPGNVMIRDGCMDGPTTDDRRCGVLIDFALVHPGHWVEDALYLERMYWGREAMLCGVEPLRCLAENRILHGLHADETDERLADIRRVLMGVTSPAFLRHENDPEYLSAALGKVYGIIPGFGVSL